MPKDHTGLYRVKTFKELIGDLNEILDNVQPFVIVGYPCTLITLCHAPFRLRIYAILSLLSLSCEYLCEYLRMNEENYCC